MISAKMHKIFRIIVAHCAHFKHKGRFGCQSEIFTIINSPAEAYIAWILWRIFSL